MKWHRAQAQKRGGGRAPFSLDAASAERRYRELLREEIAHTVNSPAEVEEEIRHLFVVVGR